MFKSMSRLGASWVIVGIAAGICALPALADDTGKPADANDHPARPVFSDIDTNSDGVISQAEFDAFKPERPEGGPDGPRPKDPGGRPGDGREGPGDYHGSRGGPGGRFHGPDLKALDADKDGKVSLDEFIGPMKKHFTEMDANKDGFLDETELKAPPPPPEGRPEGDGPPPPPEK